MNLATLNRLIENLLAVDARDHDGDRQRQRIAKALPPACGPYSSG